MPELEKAKLYTVSDPLDRPVEDLTAGETPIEVQFNPVSLKVSLANSLKENERDNNSRAAQFIEKSSSNLTVELIFDTSDSYIVPVGSEGTPQDLKDTDVRQLVRAIAVAFMHSTEVGNEDAEPQRCLFAWGAFAFVGVMESLEETLDFFSPEGIPLRATVALKLSESRFQFRSEDAEAADRDTPTLSSPESNASQAAQQQNRDESDWRETAMYNGVENPRESTPGGLSVPTAKASAALKASASVGAGIEGGFKAGLGAGFSASAGLGLSAGIGGGLSAGAGIGGGLSAGVGISGGLSGGLSAGVGAGISGGLSAGVGVSGGINGSLTAGVSSQLSSSVSGGLSTKMNVSPPAFNFGASASLGTNIPGAFSADFKNGGGVCAGALISGGVSLRDEPVISVKASGPVLTVEASVGFD